MTQQLNPGLSSPIVDVTRKNTHTHTHLLKHARRRTPLNKWSGRHRDRCLHNTQYKRRASLFSAGFELAIPKIKRPHI